MIKLLKTIANTLTHASNMRKLDAEIARLEVLATNCARRVASYERVAEAIDNGSMS